MSAVFPRREFELGAGVLEGSERDDLTFEQSRKGPFRKDARLAVERGHLAEVVGAVDQPGGVALEVPAVDPGHALVEPEGGDGSGVAVAVLGDGAAAQDGDDVVGEVPALAQLKLVFGLELRGRGDVQLYRVEVPGPKISKGFSDDERVRVSVPRSHFNELVADGGVKHWHEAYDHGHVKVEGDPNIQKLVGQVIARTEARGALRRPR